MALGCNMSWLRAIVLAVASAPIGACALYPTTHTYYEPDSRDGVPVDSQGCGYFRTGKDSLERETPGLTLTVTPSLKKDEPVSAMVVFRYPSGVLDLRGELVGMHLGNSVFEPTEFRTKLFPAHTTHGPENHQWLYLTFPAAAGTPEEISINFHEGAVRKDGAAVSISPFRFKKITKKDLYLASINC